MTHSTAEFSNIPETAIGKSSNSIMKKVHDFEPEANKLQVLSYCQTSGSTGKPKIMLFRNRCITSQIEKENAGLKGMIKKFGLKGLFGGKISF